VITTAGCGAAAWWHVYISREGQITERSSKAMDQANPLPLSQNESRYWDLADPETGAPPLAPIAQRSLHHVPQRSEALRTRRWQVWALVFGRRLTNAVRSSAANLVRVSDDGRSSWSAAWGVFALVFIGAAAIAWSAVLAHASTLDLALASLFSLLTTVSLYMCFAYLCRWWPTGRMLIGESSHIHLAPSAPYVAITPKVFISCAPGERNEFRRILVAGRSSIWHQVSMAAAFSY
jgi:hypothetical protein